MNEQCNSFEYYVMFLINNCALSILDLMKLRYLLMRYGEEVERNKKEYENEIEDSKQNGIEGFIDKDFKIPNYIYESLSFLLQIKGVELLYIFEFFFFEYF